MTTEPAQVAFSRCVDAACEVWRITPETITSTRRSMWEVVPRFACYRYLRELGFSYPVIRECHQKHHREQKRMRRINRKPRYSSGPNLPKPSAAVAELFGISK